MSDFKIRPNMPNEGRATTTNTTRDEQNNPGDHRKMSAKDKLPSVPFLAGMYK